jgi:acid phosphatase (class A)
MKALAIGTLALALAGTGVALAQAGVPAQPRALPPSLPPSLPAAIKFAPGYLAAAALPDSTALLPPPPAPGSTDEARDIEGSKAALALHGGARWALATADADVFTARATAAFSCALGIAISPQTTPLTDKLLHRTFADFGLAGNGAKRKYQRARPFMVNGQPQCTPDFDAVLRHDGSYPSGHSAIGMGWGLVLAEAAPARATQLVARGLAFGDSRRVCNVHWLSDVEAGRTVAATVFAQLNADPAFRADLDAARAELAGAKAVPSGCAAEAAALALR